MLIAFLIVVALIFVAIAALGMWVLAQIGDETEDTWTHWCPREKEFLEVKGGEPCNWCGEETP